MKRLAASAFGSVIFLFVGAGAASASWYYDWTCSEDQCASVMGGYQGRMGPYATEQSCQDAQVKYIRGSKCTDTAGSITGDIASGLTQSVIESASPQQALGAAGLVVGSMMILKGLQGLGTPTPAQRAAAERQAIQDRLKLEQAKRDKEEAQQRLLASLKTIDSGAAPALKESGGSSDLKLKLGDDAVAPPKRIISDGFTATRIGSEP